MKTLPERTARCMVCGAAMYPHPEGKPCACSLKCYYARNPMPKAQRDDLVRSCDVVAKKLAFDEALRQRWLRGLGSAPTFRPCPACGKPVEQGTFVARLFCSLACAQLMYDREP